MGKQFKLLNLIPASTAYIQRLEPEGSKESDELYPVPARINTFTKPYLMPSTHLNYSIFWGLTTCVGLVSIAKYVFMK